VETALSERRTKGRARGYEMKGKLPSLGLVLILSVLIFSSCGLATAEPTVVPTDAATEPLAVVPTEVAVQVPDPARARDVALAYISENHPEQASLPQQEWAEENVSAEGLVGSSSFQYTAGDWIVTVSFPVVNPADTIYHVVATNQASGFEWESEVNAAGQVTEIRASADIEPAVQLPDPGQALDLALTYFGERYGEEAPAAGMVWLEEQPPAEGLIGSQTIRFTSEDGEWIATVSYPVVAPEAVIYEVAVDAPVLRLRWIAKVDAAGQVTEQLAPSSAEPVACLYGRVESTPADAAIEDYLILLPEEARRALDVVGADEAIEAEIETLRDSGVYAHFWGLLDCDVPGWGGCQLVVTRLRPEGPEGPFFDPDLVEGWTGSVFSTLEDAQFDDYFVKSGSIPLRYGIDGTDAAIQAQLEEVRDTGSIIRVWGQATCPAIDFQGTHMLVDQIEVVMEASAKEGYEGWKPYLNEAFGYEIWYPVDCMVMGADLNKSVTFQGLLVDDEYWPVLTVAHYDSDFYRPPAGTDIGQWLSDMGFAYDEVVEIAGLSTAHARQDTGPGAYPSDQYFFIKDGQLFSISILHTGRQEDWDLYKNFLHSFTFPGEP